MRCKSLALALFFSASAAYACGIEQEMASPAEGAVTELSHRLHETTGQVGVPQVDLYESNPQTAPADISKRIYANLPKDNVRKICSLETLECKHYLQLSNFSCETKGVQGFEPNYVCYYGLRGQLPEAASKEIFKALREWGFVRDCNREFLQTCELDTMSTLDCTSTLPDESEKPSVSCSIEL